MFRILHLLWNSFRTAADTSTQQHTRPRRDSNLLNQQRATADPRLRHHGHRDWHLLNENYILINPEDYDKLNI
jgi:hypothetical protein